MTSGCLREEMGHNNRNCCFLAISETNLNSKELYNNLVPYLQRVFKYTNNSNVEINQDISNDLNINQTPKFFPALLKHNSNIIINSIYKLRCLICFKESFSQLSNFLRFIIKVHSKMHPPRKKRRK